MRAPFLGSPERMAAIGAKDLFSYVQFVVLFGHAQHDRNNFEIFKILSLFSFTLDFIPDVFQHQNGTHMLLLFHAYSVPSHLLMKEEFQN